CARAQGVLGARYHPHREPVQSREPSGAGRVPVHRPTAQMARRHRLADPRSGGGCGLEEAGPGEWAWKEGALRPASPLPPGNPTIEPEMIAMAPTGVSVHFSRMVARGPTGTQHGQEERNRSQIEHIDETADLLAMVKPSVMMIAHTATSYTLGRDLEAAL